MVSSEDPARTAAASAPHLLALVSVEDDARDKGLRVVREPEQGPVVHQQYELPSPKRFTTADDAPGSLYTDGALEDELHFLAVAARRLSRSARTWAAPARSSPRRSSRRCWAATAGQVRWRSPSVAGVGPRAGELG
ncbi:hypothetical protein [Streptomyces pratensis]|uniref:hypothetical protein n=1 Tax=Streptomyces pratensis TaxID=1169025 RepID=UPI00193209A1|nr:hypothetical protein [Streptomyces pratensis]